MQEEELKGVTLLVLANKQDCQLGQRLQFDLPARLYICIEIPLRVAADRRGCMHMYVRRIVGTCFVGYDDMTNRQQKCSYLSLLYASTHVSQCIPAFVYR